MALTKVKGAVLEVDISQKREEQTATAGQTVFTLTENTYNPGVNNLSVFVNGVRQGSGVYTETDSTTVTFSTGLTVTDVVEFITNDVLTSNVGDAAAVNWTPSGAGAVTRNVQDKLREMVSAADYNGDDAAALAAARASEAAQVHGDDYVVSLPGSTATFIELRGPTESGTDNVGVTWGAADVVTSTRTGQYIVYGKDHALWPGATFNTPVTDPITVPSIPTGNDKWDSTAPAVVDGHQVVRKNTLFNSNHGLTVDSDNIWSCRTPKAAIHALTDGISGTDMADMTPASDTAGIFEGVDNCYVEIWHKGAANSGEVRFRSDVAGTGVSLIKVVTASAGNESMRFIVGDAEIFRIEDNGDVMLIGKLSQDFDTDGVEIQSGQIRATNTSSAPFRANRLGSDGSVLDIENDGSVAGSITVSGGTTAYNTTSDLRLKKIYGDYEGASDLVRQIDVKEGHMLADPEQRVKQFFVAQQVQDLLPHTVTEAIPENGGDSVLQVNYGAYVPILTASLKEVLAELASAKAEIEALKLLVASIKPLG